MFEGNESSNQPGACKLKVWVPATIINALYIGCIPQCILCITDYYKGVHDWEFDINLAENDQIWRENNDALFKSQYGNSIFAVTSAILFLILIILFFCSDSIFKNRGMHCKCLFILCCPYPEPCIHNTNLFPEPTTPQARSAHTYLNEITEELAST